MTDYPEYEETQEEKQRRGQPRRYLVTVELSVDNFSDEHVQTPKALEDEVESWLTDLGCDIDSVVVEPK